MKVSTIILLLAGLVLGYVALKAEPQAERAVAAGLAPDEPVPSQLEAKIPAGYVARVIDVDGMCCKGCPRGLYEKVVAVDGVLAAAASFEDHSVSVLVPQEFPVSTLIDTLDSAKYTVTVRE